MLVVTSDVNDFEYDIHSLVRAFYPGEEVRVLVGERDGHEMISSDPGLPDIDISLFGDRLLLLLSAEDVFLPFGTDVNAGMDRRERKNVLKQLLYHALATHTGITLPWGALTGIRPVKIPMTLLEQGFDDDEIISHMAEVYFCGEKKARLALEIAKRERAILSASDYRDAYSLYVAIPFCPTTCLYCSFSSYPLAKWRPHVDAYLDALFREIDCVADLCRGKKLSTVYIGGGTPTTLTAGQLERLLGKISDTFDLGGLREYTVEAGRADSIIDGGAPGGEKLAVLRKHGVSRISINPQSMNEKTLALIGRRHSAADVVTAFHLAREIGFDNINMDMIIGLPDEGAAEVAATVAQIAALAPDSLTVHSLAVKRAAKLTEWVNEHGLAAITGSDETMQIAADGAAAMAMRPYYLYRQKNIAGNLENVGYATPGHEGLYNILMMEEVQDIVAVGAGAITKRLYPDGRIERRDNVKEPDQYVARVEEMIERKRQLLL